MRYERIIMKEESSDYSNHLKMLKDIISTTCSSTLENSIDDMKKQIAEMPKGL